MDKSQEIARLYSRYECLSKEIREIKSKGPFHKNFMYLPAYIRRDSVKKDFFRLLEQHPIDVTCEAPKNNILVSLTSFPSRIGIVHLVIKSMMLQNTAPEKIILWLSKDEFPNQMEDLPESLKSLQGNMFSIAFVDGNMKSHKKYYYAFQQYPGYSIVTVDDDLCMPFDTITRLQKLSIRFPNSVCSNVIRVIETQNGEFRKYKEWKKIDMPEPSESMNYVSIGYGGVMYPPVCFKNFEFDTNLIFSLCPNADDLWLKANEIKENIAVASGGVEFIHPITIPNTQKHSLQRTNNSSSQQNDIQWNQTCAHFGIKPFPVTA